MLYQKGAIVPSSREKDEFIATLSIVPKPNGKFRPAIHLGCRNEFVHYDHFKQETYKVVLDLIQPGDYFTSVDLYKAYFSIPNTHSISKVLEVQLEQIAVSVCLPFGL